MQRQRFLEPVVAEPLANLAVESLALERWCQNLWRWTSNSNGKGSTIGKVCARVSDTTAKASTAKTPMLPQATLEQNTAKLCTGTSESTASVATAKPATATRYAVATGITTKMSTR